MASIFEQILGAMAAHEKARRPREIEELDKQYAIFRILKQQDVKTVGKLEWEIFKDS